MPIPPIPPQKMTIKQYYYANAKDIEDCWHDEGTLPFPNLKPGDYLGQFELTWRRKPVKNKTKGLYDKFIVLRKHDATPVQYPTFVLRIDGTDPIAMEALRTYALKCNEPLASSLFKHIEDNPIKLTAQQIIEKSEYILDMFVEGVDDAQYAILQDLLALAKEGLKKDA